MQEGGLLLVAPEHRLSLHLKWHELRGAAIGGSAEAAAAVAELDGLAGMRFVDVMDESDELMHHRWAGGRAGDTGM
jgi:hypothetical protein